MLLVMGDLEQKITGNTIEEIEGGGIKSIPDTSRSLKTKTHNKIYLSFNGHTDTSPETIVARREMN